MIPAWADETIEHCQPALLVLVKAFVKRLRSVSQLLQCCPGVGHGRGASPQSLHQIIAGGCAPQRNSAVYPQLAEIAGRLFEGRPVPCLLWC
jgi:hypothetical protein